MGTCVCGRGWGGTDGGSLLFVIVAVSSVWCVKGTLGQYVYRFDLVGLCVNVSVCECLRSILP